MSKCSKRVLILSNFRNLGVDSPVEFVLNESIQKETLGGRLILVGPNNSGKSNVLAAIKALKDNNTLTSNDIPFFGDNKDRKPEITLKYIDGNNEFFCTKRLGDKIANYNYHLDSNEEIEYNYKISSSLFKKIKDIFVSNYNIYNDTKSKIQKLLSDQNTLTHKDFNQRVDSIIKAFNKEGKKDKRVFLRNSLKPVLSDLEKEKCQLSKPQSQMMKVKALFKDKYNYDFYPRIYEFDFKPFRNIDFEAAPDKWLANPFFRSLFSACSLEKGEIIDAYSYLKKNHSLQELNQLQTKASQNLDKITKRFNELYLSKKTKYLFKIIFNANSIKFELTSDSITRPIEQQSLGFQWFFSLYFAKLYDLTIQPGDIIVIDEPATALQVDSQEQLTIFLRQFAEKNHCLIVMATQSPFLIETLRLEDLRLVSYDNEGKANIKNHFHAVDKDEKDTLTPISRALCTRNSVIIDPDVTKVFVEGFTDYAYLSAFIEKNKIQNLALLPINGVGANDNECKRYIKRIMAIQKKPNILVDGDGAGLAFKKISPDEARVRTLTDLLPNVKEIEKIFNEEEINKFNLRSKNAGNAIALKHQIINGSATLSNETIQRFLRLIDLIQIVYGK